MQALGDLGGLHGLAEAIADIREMREAGGVVAVADVQHVLGVFAGADTLDEVFHVVRAVGEVFKLRDGLALVVVGLAFGDVAAFAVDDVAIAHASIGRGAEALVHVLHGQAKLVHDERHGRVGMEGDLAVRGEAVIGVAPAIAEAHHALWQRVGIAECPAGDVVLVRALIADVAISIRPLPVPVVVELFAQNGQFGARCGPQFVIDGGWWLLRAVHFIDAHAQTVHERVGELHFADVAFVDPLHRRCPAEVGTALHAVLDDEALGGGFLRGGHEFGAFEEIVAHGFLHIDMLAMLQRGEGD